MEGQNPWIQYLERIKGLTEYIKMYEENSKVVDNRSKNTKTDKENYIGQKRNERKQLQGKMCVQLPEILEKERCKSVVKIVLRVCANLVKYT